jgi:hypothetical protein
LPLFQSAGSRHPHILVPYAAVNIRLLFTTLKEGAGNVSLGFTDMHHIQQHTAYCTFKYKLSTPKGSDKQQLSDKIMSL